jgi:extradiol dioxygenase family protein
VAIQLFNADDYRAANSDLASFSNEQALSHFQTFGLNEGRTFSALVNLDFYRSSNSDLSNFSNIQAFEHLQNNGVAEGRQFSEFVDLGFYRAANNDLQGLNNEQLLGHLQNNGVTEGRQFSEFVDLGFYRAANNDLQGLNNEQLLGHLQNNGVAEGRQFSEFVDLGFYRAANNDLQGLNNEQLLGHLELNGIGEGRQFSQFVDLDFYQAANSDLGGLNNQQLLGHLQTNGVAEGRRFSEFVDLDFYQATNSDLGSLNNEQLLGHLELNGIGEGRQFSQFFDINYYRSNNADLVAANLNSEELLEHFEINGLSEGRLFSVPLDVNYYRSVNPDLAAANLNNQQLYDHFQLNGLSERRVSSSSFNLPVYLANNPDLVAAGLDQKLAYDHFVISGQSEGRPGSDYAGNTLSTARNITIGSTANTFFDFVYSDNAAVSNTNPTDPDDYYSFTLANASSLNVSLSGLSGNADLRLLRGTNGEVIGTSANSGTTPESISRNNLAAGTYAVQVFGGDVQSAFTHYNLSLSANANPPVNDAPVNTVPLAQTTNEDTPLVFSTANSNLISINDVDAGNNPVEVTLSATDGLLSLNGINGLTFTTGDGTDDVTTTFSGTLSDINTALDGSSFSPTNNFSGAATLAISTNDQGNTGTGGPLTDADTVNITVNANPPVNDAPVNTVPLPQITNEDTPLVFSTANSNLISINDVDADNNPVEVTLSATNGSLNLSGTTGLTFTTGDGTDDVTTTFSGTISNINTALDGLSFSPTANHSATTNFSGPATLAISTNDLGNTGTGGPLTDTDTVNITFKAVNDAPVNTVPLAQTTNEDTPLVFSTANSNLISINDVDADNNPVEVTLSATDGLLSLNGINGLTFTTGDGTDDVTTTFSGTLSDINTALDGSSFSPTNNFSGAATLAISTNDQGNTGTGGPLTDTDTVNITVNANPPVNDAPVLDLSGNVQPGNNFSKTTLAANTGTVNVVNSSFTLVDVDSTNLTSAIITLTDSVNPDEILSASGGATAIDVSSYNSTTRQLTLSGSATLADYRTVISSIRYQKTTPLAPGDTRRITFEINDGLNSNILVTTTLNFI